MSYWIAGAAAVGALVDHKNPLRGAALGAGTMATGGALAGGFGAAGAGASTVGAMAPVETGISATGVAANSMANMPAVAGTAAPGLLSGAQTAGTYGTTLGSSQTAMLAGQDAAFGGSAAAQGGNSAWATAKGLAPSMSTVKDAGTVLGAASAANSLMPHPKPIQTPQIQAPMPNSSLGQMYQQMQQQQAQQVAQSQQLRQMKRGIL